MSRAGREDPVVKFHCDEELRDEFDEIAKKHDMNRSQMLRRAMIMVIRADNQNRLNSIDFTEV